MSDLVNALNQQSGQSNLLNVLSTAHVANPLAAIQAGNQAASTFYDLKQKQATQAAGEAFLNSIDPATGQPNQALLMQNLRADPRTAMAAQESAQRGVNLDTTTYNLHNARINSSMTAMSQLIADNPQGVPADALHAAIDEQLKQGNMTAQEAQNAHNQVTNNPTANTAFLLRGMGHALDARTQLDAVKPPITTQDVGGRIVTTRPSPQAGSGGGPPSLAVGGGVSTGPQPGPTVKTSLPVDASGAVIPLDANGAPTRPPHHWDEFTVPVQKVPGMPTGGQPVPAPGSPAQPGTSNAPPPPPPGSTIRSPGAYPGKRSDIPSSSQVASADNSVVPSNLPPATPPSPAVAGDVAAIQGGMTNAQATPADGTQTAQLGPYLRAAPPQGQPEKLKADVEAYTNDQANYPNVQTSAQNLGHAYVALQQLKSATGKGAAGINDLRSYAQTLGILPAGAVKEQELFELVNKYTEREMIAAAGGSTTDMGRRMQEQANAGTLLSTPANLEILRNDLGKKMQAVAAYKDQSDKTGAGYLDARANVADKTDSRGFVWNLYSPDEQAAINAEVAKDKSGVAAQKLHKAIGMAQRLQLQIPGLTTGQQGAAQPPAAALPTNVAAASPNALAQAGQPPANALAA